MCSSLAFIMHKVAFILLIIGGLNWLLIGLFNWGIGNLFGDSMMVPKIIYILVGLAALYELFTHKKMCKGCDNGTMNSQSGGMK